MTVRCPFCSAGHIVANLGWGQIIVGKCKPCAGSGKLELITRHEYELSTGWLTPAQVVAMKARGELGSKSP